MSPSPSLAGWTAGPLLTPTASTPTYPLVLCLSHTPLLYYDFPLLPLLPPCSILLLATQPKLHGAMPGSGAARPHDAA